MSTNSYPKEPSGTKTILWWLGWIALTIVSFFVSAYFWTGYIAKHVGTMENPGVPIIWVTAVFGTWMVLLVPLIIVMYSKVDKAYEDARITREAGDFQKRKKAMGVKCVLLSEDKRTLPKSLRDKLKAWPPVLKNAHLVTAVLEDGKKVSNLFVYNRKDIMGAYEIKNPADFDARKIKDIVSQNTDKLPNFNEDKWTRFDGVGETVVSA